MSGISDNQPVDNRGFLDRLVPTLLVITSLVLASFTGFDVARGYVEWSLFEGAVSAVGIAAAVPVTRKIRRLPGERGERAGKNYGAEGDISSVPLQPYSWTKSVMAVAILPSLASSGFMLTTGLAAPTRKPAATSIRDVLSSTVAGGWPEIGRIAARTVLRWKFAPFPPWRRALRAFPRADRAASAPRAPPTRGALGCAGVG